MVEKLAFNVLLITRFTDEHITVALLEEQKVTVCKSSPVALMEQENFLSNPVVNFKNTDKVPKQTNYDARDDIMYDEKQFSLSRIV